jgi:hypothetical protein
MLILALSPPLSRIAMLQRWLVTSATCKVGGRKSHIVLHMSGVRWCWLLPRTPMPRLANLVLLWTTLLALHANPMAGWTTGLTFTERDESAISCSCWVCGGDHIQQSFACAACNSQAQAEFWTSMPWLSAEHLPMWLRLPGLLTEGEVPRRA